MAYYFFPPLIWHLYCVFLRPKLTGYDQALISSLLLFPLFAVPVLRGLVGTDTASYISSITSILDGSNIEDVFEPGFYLLIAVFSKLSSNPDLIVATISGLASLLLFTASKKWGGSAAFFSSLIVPIYFFDFTMNALRVGLAFPLMVFSAYFWEEDKKFRSILFLLAGAALQLTSIAILPLLLIRYFLKTSFTKKMIAASIFSVLIALFIPYVTERAASKFELYSEYASPTSLSDIVPLLLALIFLIISHLPKKNGEYSSDEIVKTNTILTLLQIAFYIVTTFSYAGIRFQMLTLFVQMLFWQRYWLHMRFPTSLKITILSSLFLLTSLWRLRGYHIESIYPTTLSPFLPYRFFWQ